MAHFLVIFTDVCLLFICLLFSKIHSEVFTAVSDLEYLLNTEELFIEYLTNYISVQDSKLEYLQRYQQ